MTHVRKKQIRYYTTKSNNEKIYNQLKHKNLEDKTIINITIVLWIGYKKWNNPQIFLQIQNRFLCQVNSCTYLLFFVFIFHRDSRDDNCFALNHSEGKCSAVVSVPFSYFQANYPLRPSFKYSFPNRQRIISPSENATVTRTVQRRLDDSYHVRVINFVCRKCFRLSIIMRAFFKAWSARGRCTERKNATCPPPLRHRHFMS